MTLVFVVHCVCVGDRSSRDVTAAHDQNVQSELLQRLWMPAVAKPATAGMQGVSWKMNEKH